MREVKKVRLKLYDKNAALMSLARVMRWIGEKDGAGLSEVERLRAMTPEQRAADAAELARRVHERLAQLASEPEVLDLESEAVKN